MCWFSLLVELHREGSAAPTACKAGLFEKKIVNDGKKVQTPGQADALAVIRWKDSTV